MKTLWTHDFGFNVATCGTCGGPGFNPKACYEWFGAVFYHRDSSICRYYLEEAERKKHRQKEKESSEYVEQLKVAGMI